MTADDGLSAFDSTDEGPVAIVFGTFNYRPTVWRWIEAARRASCAGWRIVCLDRDLVRWLQEHGAGAQAVYYYDVLPDAPRHDFAALQREALLRALLPLRTRLFLHLANAGRDFVHSDADAVWTRDPRRYMARHPDFDLLFSQGTWFPPEHYSRFGFVLCAGFFLCRSNARTRDFFERVEALGREDVDDQRRMNHVLLQDPEARWEIFAPVLRIRHLRPRWRRVLARLRRHVLARLRRHLARSRRIDVRSLRDRLTVAQREVAGSMLRPRHPKRRWRRVRLPLGQLQVRSPWVDVQSLRDRLAEARKDGSLCVPTSESIIRGGFSAGLTVGVIPMHLVTRFRLTTHQRSLVVHK